MKIKILCLFAVLTLNGLPQSCGFDTLYYLHYPNPFNPRTKIKFTIASADGPLLGGARGGLVTLKVCDILGNEVATLVNEYKPAGSYEAEFDGSKLASRVYFL